MKKKKRNLYFLIIIIVISVITLTIGVFEIDSNLIIKINGDYLLINAFLLAENHA